MKGSKNGCNHYLVRFLCLGKQKGTIFLTSEDNHVPIFRYGCRSIPKKTIDDPNFVVSLETQFWAISHTYTHTCTHTNCAHRYAKYVVYGWLLQYPKSIIEFAAMSRTSIINSIILYYIYNCDGKEGALQGNS